MAWIGGSIAAVVVIAGIVAFVVTRPADAPPPPPSKDAVALGCVSCHSTDGARSEGPTWKGLYGSTVTLADGSTVTVDDAYLRRAILDPQADVAPGYVTAMPTLDVSDAQLDRLVAYIKGLSD
jgi:cytochrome c oxidase subunit 2